MTELKIDRDKMLEAAESCNDVKRIFEKLWPEEFKEEVPLVIGGVYTRGGFKYIMLEIGREYFLINLLRGILWYYPQLPQYMEKDLAKYNFKYLGKIKDVLIEYDD